MGCKNTREIEIKMNKYLVEMQNFSDKNKIESYGIRNISQRISSFLSCFQFSGFFLQEESF